MAASSVSLPLQVITDPIKKKRKRFNKNKKKAWRTKIDISDIDTAFEETRREERFGGPIAEQSTENLFTIDIGGDLPSLTVDKVGPIEKLSIAPGLKPTARKERRKTLNCHKLLKGLPGVKPISKKKATQPQLLEKRVRLIRRVDREQGLRDTIRLENIVQQSNKDQKNHRLTRNKRTFVRNKFSKDLWNRGAYDGTPVNVDINDEVAESYIAPNIEYMANAMKRRAPKRPIHGVTSTIPAVEIPKAGVSYNPKFEDHQQLLLEAMEQEVEVLVEKKKREDYVAKVLPIHGIAKPSEDIQLEEMTQGVAMLNGGTASDDEYESVEDDEEEPAPVPKIKEKKSSQERRKMVKRRHLERRLQIEKDKKRRESEVFRVKSITKELNQIDKIKERMKEKRLQRIKEALGRPKRLSKLRTKKLDVVCPLQSELRSRLLEVKHIGNPLEEKYRLLHHRNLLETRGGRKKAQKSNRKFYKKGKTNVDPQKLKFRGLKK